LLNGFLFYNYPFHEWVVNAGAIPVGTVAARSIMRRNIWLVLICLIGLGAVVAIKIGAKTPEGADVDKAKVGAAIGQGTPIRAKNIRA
jgi:hypothetical protein